MNININMSCKSMVLKIKFLAKYNKTQQYNRTVKAQLLQKLNNENIKICKNII